MRKGRQVGGPVVGLVEDVHLCKGGWWGRGCGGGGEGEGGRGWAGRRTSHHRLCAFAPLEGGFAVYGGEERVGVNKVDHAHLQLRHVARQKLVRQRDEQNHAPVVVGGRRLDHLRRIREGRLRDSPLLAINAVWDRGAGAGGPLLEAGSAALGEDLRIGTVPPRLRLEHLVDALRVVDVLVLGETALVLVRFLRELVQTVVPVLVVAPRALDVQLVLPQVEAVATERALTRRMRQTPEGARTAGRASVAHESMAGRRKQGAGGAAFMRASSPSSSRSSREAAGQLTQTAGANRSLIYADTELAINLPTPTFQCTGTYIP